MTFEKAAKVVTPYLVCFLAGVLLAWKGCGGGKVKPETVTIEKPIPIKSTKEQPTSKGRFVSQPIPIIKPKGVLSTSNEPKSIIHTNTPFASKIALEIDSAAIVNAWLTERLHYDTTATFEGADIRLRWQNYQNQSERLRIEYTPKKVPLKWALGIHANAGLISDFQTRYTPLFGLGLQATIKKTYIAANYGFNGQHYIGVTVGRNIIQR